MIFRLIPLTTRLMITTITMPATTAVMALMATMRQTATTAVTTMIQTTKPTRTSASLGGPPGGGVKSQRAAMGTRLTRLAMAGIIMSSTGGPIKKKKTKKKTTMRSKPSVMI